jgi:protein-tyrosine phosphatase
MRTTADRATPSTLFGLDQGTHMNRLLPLQGARNFRDMGGYETTDGRRLRWGKLLRSGVMTYLTEDDHDYLAGLGVRVLCDFRSLQEREREPTHWRPQDSEYLSWDYDRNKVTVMNLFKGADATAERAHLGMVSFYRDFPYLFREQYTAMFAKLTAGEVPLVFNCSAGKDRTGVAAALALSALGIKREQIIGDYTLTNTAVDLDKELVYHPRRSVGLGDDRSYIARLSPELRKPLLTAAPEYIAATFDQLEKDHGSVNGFIHAVLGFDESKLENMRDVLLEKA